MKSTLLSFALILITTSLFAQFTIQDILSAPFASELVVAKQSEQVAWVVNASGVRNIWMTNGKNIQAQQLTDFQEDDGQAINNLIFKENSEELIFVRGGAPNRRGEIPNPSSHVDGAKRFIFKIALNGKGQLDTLAEGSSPLLSPDGSTLAFSKSGQICFYDFSNKKAKQAFHIRGGASDLNWSPDGEKLAFVSNRGDHSFVGIYNLAEKKIRYLQPSVDHDSNPVWSPDGQSLAFLRIPNEKNVLIFFERREGLPWSIWRHDFTNDKTYQVWEAAEGTGSIFRSISADHQLFWTKNNRIVFPYEGNAWTQLWSVAANGGEAQNMMINDEFEVQFASLAADGNSILYSSNQNDIDRQHIWKVKYKEKPIKLTNTQGIEWLPVSTSDGTIYCIASTAKDYAQVSRIEDSKVIRLQTLKSDFPNNNQLVEPEQVIFSAADGMQIHGQLFKPKNLEKNKKYSAVIFFHGGSRRQMLLGFHHRGYYHNAYALNQYLAYQGYIVLSVNYRSGIGYGMKFREALNYGAEGASEYNDVLGAGLYLQNLPEVENQKIGLWGGSYGGYLTALGLAKASDLFAAGVDIHGVHDWNAVIKNFMPQYDITNRPKIAEAAWLASPMPYLDTWKSPVLVIHGDDDRNVPFSETVDLVEGLRKRKVPVEQLIFPDEVHGFLLHCNWVKAYEATADFFDRKLKGKK